MTRPNPSVELRRGGFEGAPCDSSYLAQDSVSGKSVAKAYVDARVAFHVHVRFGSSDHDGQAQDFCAYLKRDPERVLSSHRSGAKVAVPPDWLPRELQSERGDKNGLHQPMLVIVGEVSKKLEGMSVAASPIPSAIRLHLLDECPMSGGQTLQEGVERVSNQDTKSERQRVDLAQNDDPFLSIDIGVLPHSYFWRIRTSPEFVACAPKGSHVFVAPIQLSKPNLSAAVGR